MSTAAVPVVVVGAGPSGLTAATLLAQYGIETVVLERWNGVYPQPRAVHLDGEVRRILTRLRVGTAFDAISRPALGLRLIDGVGRHVLAQFDRDPNPGRNGHPEANLFDQPELEAILRENAGHRSEVTIRGEVEVIGSVDEIDCVRVDYIDRRTGARNSIRGRYLLGCDGANSIVRTSMGVGMRDFGFRQRWLVVDVATSAELAQWDGIHQVSDPNRAATFMRIGEQRYRWEFQLLPNESASDYQKMEDLLPLIRPWTESVALADFELLRVAEYTFCARVAQQWRSRRTFLLGDAAHLTPPFIGQGMGAGLRDAANLSWKLAAVLSGELGDDALDSYEIERKPHAQAMIRIAMLLGASMTAGGEIGSRARRVFAPHVHRMPGFDRRFINGETPALHHSSLVTKTARFTSLAGRLVPNPPLPDGRRLDDLITGRFALITSRTPTAAQRAMVEDRAAVLIITNAGEELHRWLRQGRARAALIRPDGTVQCAGRDLSRLCDAVVRLPVSDTCCKVVYRDRCSWSDGAHDAAEAGGIR
ncbi:monooxygenase [Rhodococcus rhodochrous]|uniref:bifunctional 3-(3-hydroxy-phenyl)propionate/3-hydroxycinnamic acid hydroxylase MhpA n=1 Tax=Rhodococcus rhodochrous TaxID=1829 RepID=UPI0007CD7EEA|nr:bifunctional 3-(3-hydroxy-phenyl)propionate/3-hydroxycinnamic acid hydroxylase [Rhodococcus rhodochrous]MDO1486919.1 bifunctional 3-(3-hydroxy-phenyl)propionate/3-hydroxycinnamic acid hydroxylase [Rhodococcus rhodochrous]SNV22099.1 monooxygenase [Rhodococcus rhodochrous]